MMENGYGMQSSSASTSGSGKGADRRSHILPTPEVNLSEANPAVLCDLTKVFLFLASPRGILLVFGALCRTRQTATNECICSCKSTRTCNITLDEMYGSGVLKPVPWNKFGKMAAHCHLPACVILGQNRTEPLFLPA